MVEYHKNLDPVKRHSYVADAMFNAGFSLQAITSVLTRIDRKPEILNKLNGTENKDHLAFWELVRGECTDETISRTKSGIGILVVAANTISVLDKV